VEVVVLGTKSNPEWMKNKKRYQVSLSKDSVEIFRAMAAEVGFSKSFMSEFLNISLMHAQPMLLEMIRLKKGGNQDVSFRKFMTKVYEGICKIDDRQLELFIAENFPEKGAKTK